MQVFLGSTNSMILAWFGLMASIMTDRRGTASCPGDGNLTAFTGTLRSPGFPTSPYPPNTVCIWVITAPKGGRVKLAITSMHLEYCPLCHCDYVEVRDGAAANSQLVGKFCTAKNATFYSEGKQMWVKFKSDMANEQRGFSASFSYIKLRKKEPVNLRAKETSQFITSSNNPAVCGSSRQCTWVIYANEGFNVRLTLKSFDFSSCLGSFIEIRDGPRGSDQLIGRFCGDEKPPQDICSKGNSLWITFTYNSTRDLQTNRFRLQYRELQCASQEQKQFFTKPLNSDHWRSMAVGLACTSFALFVILVSCFLKIANNVRIMELERATSLIEQNPTESSIAETTFSNDMEACCTE